jgi:hypothetical protein
MDNSVRQTPSGELIYASDNNKEPNYAMVDSAFGRPGRGSFVNRFEEVYAKAVGRANRGRNTDWDPKAVAFDEAIMQQRRRSSAADGGNHQRHTWQSPTYMSGEVQRGQSQHLGEQSDDNTYSAMSEVDFDAITIGDRGFLDFSPDGLPNESEDDGDDPVYGLASQNDEGGSGVASDLRSQGYGPPESTYSVVGGPSSRLNRQAISVNLGNQPDESEDNYDLTTMRHLSRGGCNSRGGKGHGTNIPMATYQTRRRTRQSAAPTEGGGNVADYDIARPGEADSEALYEEADDVGLGSQRPDEEDSDTEDIYEQEDTYEQACYLQNSSDGDTANGGSSIKGEDDGAGPDNGSGVDDDRSTIRSPQSREGYSSRPGHAARQGGSFNEAAAAPTSHQSSFAGGRLRYD